MRVVKGYEEYVSSPVIDENDYGEAPKGHSRVVQIIVNSDMRTWLKGLTKTMHSEGIDPATLEPGQYVIFINNAKTKMKFFCANGVIAYLNNDTKPITRAHLSAVPAAFKGADLSFGEALEAELGNLLEGVEAPAEERTERTIIRRSTKRVALNG